MNVASSWLASVNWAGLDGTDPVPLRVRPCFVCPASFLAKAAWGLAPKKCRSKPGKGGGGLQIPPDLHGQKYPQLCDGLFVFVTGFLATGFASLFHLAPIYPTGTFHKSVKLRTNKTRPNATCEAKW